MKPPAQQTAMPLKTEGGHDRIPELEVQDQEDGEER